MLWIEDAQISPVHKEGLKPLKKVLRPKKEFIDSFFTNKWPTEK